MVTYVYDPKVFDMTDLSEAKGIVLTSECGVSTETRWETETPWLMSLIEKHIKHQGVVVDYGCGVGRISQRLVADGQVTVGVDMSPVMRQHAMDQVGSNQFTAISPESLDVLALAGMRADTVLAIWVLQHCYDGEEVLARIDRVLKPGGVLFVADMKHRAVPTDQGWVDDGINLYESLSKRFSHVETSDYLAPNAPENLVGNAYVAIFRKRRNEL